MPSRGRRAPLSQRRQEPTGGRRPVREGALLRACGRAGLGPAWGRQAGRGRPAQPPAGTAPAGREPGPLGAEALPAPPRARRRRSLRGREGAREPAPRRAEGLEGGGARGPRPPLRSSAGPRASSANRGGAQGSLRAARQSPRAAAAAAGVAMETTAGPVAMETAAPWLPGGRRRREPRRHALLVVIGEIGTEPERGALRGALERGEERGRGGGPQGVGGGGPRRRVPRGCESARAGRVVPAAARPEAELPVPAPPCGTAAGLRPPPSRRHGGAGRAVAAAEGRAGALPGPLGGRRGRRGRRPLASASRGRGCGAGRGLRLGLGERPRWSRAWLAPRWRSPPPVSAVTGASAPARTSPVTEGIDNEPVWLWSRRRACSRAFRPYIAVSFFSP